MRESVDAERLHRFMHELAFRSRAIDGATFRRSVLSALPLQ